MPFFTNRGITPLPVGGGGGGTVLIDDVSFLNALGTVSPSTLRNADGNFVNIGSGPNGTTNRAVILAIIDNNAAAGTHTITSVVWNGTQSMTAIGSSPYAGGGNGNIWLYGLVNPDTGANNCVVTWTGGSVTFGVFSLSFVNVDQTGGSTTFHGTTSATATGTSASVVSPAISGEASIAIFEHLQNFNSGQNQTDLHFNNAGSVSAEAGNYNMGTAAPTMTYSGTVSAAWLAVTVAIKAV